MGSREYNGEPLDMSWNTPPWANDGETVAASDDDTEPGTMTTTDWPEAATPKDELTDKQQRIIQTAAKYPYLEYAGDLYEQSDLDEHVSREYVAPVLTDHWREWFDTGDGSGSKQSKDKRDKADYTQKLNTNDVKELREKALNGKSRRELADEYPATGPAIYDALCGNTWESVQSPPPLEYDAQSKKWTIYSPTTGNGKQKKITDKKCATEMMREMALDGTPAKEIASKIDYSSPDVGRFLKGEADIGDADESAIPPLEYDRSERSWVVAESKDEVETGLEEPQNNTGDEQSELTDIDTDDTDEQPDTPTEPETPSTTPETPSETRDYTKLAAVAVVTYHLLKTLWSLVSRSDD